MKFKILFLTAIFAVVSLSLFAENEKNDENTKKMTELQAKQTELLLELHRTRAKLISEDEDIKELHEKIISLHKELAEKLEKRKEIKKLFENIKDVEDEVAEVKKKMKN